MVDFKRITDRAKDLVEKRGGTDSLKRDANELKDIAQGPGTFKDKAKAAVDALKEPGGAEAANPAAGAATTGEPARAAENVQGGGRARHKRPGQGRHGKRHGGGRGRGGDGDPAV